VSDVPVLADPGKDIILQGMARWLAALKRKRKNIARPVVDPDSAMVKVHQGAVG
jgi:hypothetical protein